MRNQSKPLTPVKIHITAARMMDCHKLYEQFRVFAETDDVILTITPIDTKNQPIQSLKQIVPESRANLSEYCATGFSSFEICGDYKIHEASPSKLMTLADFVMNTLTVWDRMYYQISDQNRETCGANLRIAADVLRGTYAVEELGDINYLEQEEPLRHSTSTDVKQDTQPNLSSK